MNKREAKKHQDQKYLSNEKNINQKRERDRLYAKRRREQLKLKLISADPLIGLATDEERQEILHNSPQALPFALTEHSLKVQNQEPTEEYSGWKELEEGAILEPNYFEFESIQNDEVDESNVEDNNQADVTNVNDDSFGFDSGFSRVTESEASNYEQERSNLFDFEVCSNEGNIYYTITVEGNFTNMLFKTDVEFYKNNDATAECFNISAESENNESDRENEGILIL